MATPFADTYSFANGVVVYGGRVAPGSEPIVSLGAYRTAQNYLFQSASVGTVPSTLGGADYFGDIWGPSRLYVAYQGGWAWNTPGGDVLSTPAATVDLNSGSGSTGPSANYTYSVNITSLVQLVQTGGRWMAIRITTPGGARALAGKGHQTYAAPSILVNYTDGGSAVLVCRVIARASSGSAYPSTLVTVQGLPVFIEFEKPTKAVASATLTMTVVEHWTGTSTATIQLLDPPLNTAPDTATNAGLAASAGPKDSGLAAVPGVIGVHRYLDGSALSDFFVSVAVATSSETSYSPEFWGGAADTNKFPYLHAGKWITTNGRPAPSLVDSSYTGEGFTPLTSGMGALKLTIADLNPATGDEVTNGGTIGADLHLFMPPAHFGTLGRLFVRYYVRLGTPLTPTSADRVEILSAGAPRWTSLSGKWGINASHATSYGGVSGSSGGGYGWQMRNSWYECEAQAGGPDEHSIVAGHHLFDFQGNNPVGHRYGSEQPAQFERWGQLGGKGANLYAGRWYLVEQELKLNSINTSNGTYSEDGELRTWLDGFLVFERTGLVFRTAPLYQPTYDPSKLRAALQLGVRELWLNWFHGGQEVSTYPRTAFYTGLAYGTSRIGAMNMTTVAMPTWVPAAGATGLVGYTTGSHPVSGWGASVVDLDPLGDSWNPTPSNSGPWNAGVSYAYPFHSVNSYSGGAWSVTQRKFLMLGAGHSAYSIPVPYSYSVANMGWKWEAVPVPSDGLAKCNKAQLTRSLVEAQYPTTQFNYTWGEWQGDYSGWPAGFSRAGEIFPEVAHSYGSLVWIPGSAIGNTNGAMLITSQATGISTGSDMIGGGHHFNLDTGKWVRNANQRTGTVSQSNAAAGGACWFGGSVNKAFALGYVSSATATYIDVFDPATKTWVQRTSTNSVDLPLVNGGISAHEAGGLLLLPCPETSGGGASYLGVRHRLYATSAAAAAAGGHTWTILNVSASSWPLNTVGTGSGTIGGVNWCYCPRNGCFYALPMASNGTTLWKLSPPSGASTLTQYLTGTWTVTSETLSSSVRMRNLDDSLINAGAEAYIYNRLVWDELTGCLLYFDSSAYAKAQAIHPQGV